MYEWSKTLLGNTWIFSCGGQKHSLMNIQFSYTKACILATHWFSTFTLTYISSCHTLPHCKCKFSSIHAFWMNIVGNVLKSYKEILLCEYIYCCERTRQGSNRQLWLLKFHHNIPLTMFNSKKQKMGFFVVVVLFFHLSYIYILVIWQLDLLMIKYLKLLFISYWHRNEALNQHNQI